MRVLLDECLPRKLKLALHGHETWTVPEVGWAGTKNGALLRLAATQFDVFVTIDRGISAEQNLAAITRGTQLRVIVLSAPDNRLETLLPSVPRLHVAIADAQAGDVVRVGA